MNEEGRNEIRSRCGCSLILICHNVTASARLPHETDEHQATKTSRADRLCTVGVVDVVYAAIVHIYATRAASGISCVHQ